MWAQRIRNNQVPLRQIHSGHSHLKGTRGQAVLKLAPKNEEEDEEEDSSIRAQEGTLILLLGPIWWFVIFFF
jgi:hypothetical protein